MLTVKQAEACLDSLGNNEREVAASLQSLGIKGSRCNSESCPIARYIVSCGANAGRISVGPDRVALNCGQETVNFSYQIRDFIRAFDMNVYPNLMDKS